MKENKKNIFILIAAFCIYLLISGIYFGYRASQTKPKIKEEKTTIKNKTKKKQKTTKDIVKEKYNNPLPAYQQTYQNQEIVGELSIPSIELTEPVAQHTDNDFYLTHDLYQKDSKTGSIFVDYRTESLNKAKQINIYGHNSDYYTLPFKKLENYLVENFAKDNPYIYLNTNLKSLTYKIFSVKIFTNEDEHTVISIGDTEEFVSHVAAMRSGASYDSGEVIKPKDKILVLQTCLYNPVNTKLLVLAKLEK